MNDNKIMVYLNDVNTIKKFINVTRRFESDIDAFGARFQVDAKSILALFSVDLSKGIYVQILSDDKDEIEKFTSAMEEFK